MNRRWFLLGGAALLAAPAVAVPLALAPGRRPQPAASPPAIAAAEHAATIQAMRPPKRARPVIAIFALNAATEITDLMATYGVLRTADVAETAVVAERADPIPLFPFSRFGKGPELLRIEPQTTTRAFDASWPDGADYVIVPAVEPRDDPFALAWILDQHRKGATIVSVCAGALTLAAAGLLDGRRATTHWAYVEQLQKDHPTLRWVRDRRYVADDGVVTATGITASIPVSLALVEAIAGRARAEQAAQRLGVAHWDARHSSAAFRLTAEHRKTFMRNWLSPWRGETVGVPVGEGVDEIALALQADAYSRTSLGEVVTIGTGAAALRGRNGLTIHPRAPGPAARVDRMLAPPSADAPAKTIERALADIAIRFGRPTAEIVALQLEYA